MRKTNDASATMESGVVGVAARKHVHPLDFELVAVAGGSGFSLNLGFQVSRSRPVGLPFALIDTLGCDA